MIYVYAHNKQCSVVAAPLFVRLCHLGVSINGHLHRLSHYVLAVRSLVTDVDVM